MWSLGVHDSHVSYPEESSLYLMRACVVDEREWLLLHHIGGRLGRGDTFGTFIRAASSSGQLFGAASGRWTPRGR